MGGNILADPSLQTSRGGAQVEAFGGLHVWLRGFELRADAFVFVDSRLEGCRIHARKLCPHLVAVALQPQLFDQDLDPGLVLVVPAAVQVVDAQHGVEQRQQVGQGHGLFEQFGDPRCPALTATDIEVEDGVAAVVGLGPDADVVEFHRGAVFGGAGDGKLELARQKREFRVQHRPLPQQLGDRTRVDKLIRCHPGEGVGGYVADTVARGLDRVHLHRSQMVENIGGIDQLGPVELNVLPGGEMPVALVVGIGDVAQLAQLGAVQLTVRDGDAQHVGVELQVQPVLQSQRAELFFTELAGQAALDLVAELARAVLHEGLIVSVVGVHVRRSLGCVSGLGVRRRYGYARPRQAPNFPQFQRHGPGTVVGPQSDQISADDPIGSFFCLTL